MEIKEFFDGSEKIMHINLRNGIVYMNERVSKILNLYDTDLIMDAINSHMEQMRNTGTLNTGKIDLPSGFHMFDSFFSVAGVSTHLGLKPPTSFPEQSVSHLTLSIIGYYDSEEEPLSIKEYAKKLFDLKQKYVLMGKRGLYFGDYEIDFEKCFDRSNPIILYRLFKDMQNNFAFSDIDNMIYAHSIFGEAYTNAVKRVSDYDDDGIECINVPESYVVYEEFTKLLRKYYFAGYKFSEQIYICYVADYLNPNKEIN